MHMFLIIEGRSGRMSGLEVTSTSVVMSHQVLQRGCSVSQVGSCGVPHHRVVSGAVGGNLNCQGLLQALHHAAMQVLCSCVLYSMG